VEKNIAIGFKDIKLTEMDLDDLAKNYQ